MKFWTLLLQEGRKEDLIKKYGKDHYTDIINMVLNDDFIESTNYKYADFILKHLKIHSLDEITKILGLVKKFDRIFSNLPKKDINQYKSYDELSDAVESYTSKSQENKGNDGVKKLYEDKSLLIVKILDYKASCKYGSGTKWCTTSKPEYFSSYTKNDQALYYVILKKYNISNKFYKIAVHKNENKTTWFDATDTAMSEREVEAFLLGAPKVIETIDSDYDKMLGNRLDRMVRDMFDDYPTSTTELEFANFNFPVQLEFSNSESVPDMEGHALMTMKIYINSELIDSYTVFAICSFKSKDVLLVRYGFDSELNKEDPKIDLGLDSESGTLEFWVPKYPSPDISSRAHENFISNISRLTRTAMIYNEDYTTFMFGKNTWYTNGRGYKFKQNKGMIKQMVDYLDSGYDNGTKLDFLVYIGKLKRRITHGEPEYSFDGDTWQSSRSFRGQYSTFFAAAQNAGIIQYVKEGNKFIIKAGKNFKSFKEGNLKAI